MLGHQCRVEVSCCSSRQHFGPNDLDLWSARLSALRQIPGAHSEAVGEMGEAKHIENAYTNPGKPWQNGSVESFNSRFRDKCLNMEWFANRREARVIVDACREKYNSQRSHSAINHRIPAEVRMTWSNPHGLAETDAA